MAQKTISEQYAEQGAQAPRPSAVTRPFAWTGKKVVRWVSELGASAIFLGKALSMIIRPKQFGAIVRQTYHIGARSTSIIALVALFTGMVLGLQSYNSLVQYGAQGTLGALVALSLIRELGPVLTAVMITARAGSAMAAEIGMQRISEQIDALQTMRVDPIRFLVSPKIAASIISFPILTAFFDLIGIIGAYVPSVILLDMDAGAYIYRVQSSVDLNDVTEGFIKSLVFAVIVSAVSCYQGYFTHMRTDGHGAKAVGLSTTSAVVISCALILISDYVVTSLLM